MPLTGALPKHIAIIMDGNGRWAKKRSLPHVAGHQAGVEAARNIVKACLKYHISVLTLFAFSSENWGRPQEEVNDLMSIFLTGLRNEVGMMHENNIKLRFIGDRTRFNPELVNQIDDVEKLTSNNTGLVLMIAADYGGQWDICEATKRLARDVESGKLTSNDITIATISDNLSFSDLPNPDLFIRTSGEIRISNFMLWQLAYSELYFTDTLWPDFDEQCFKEALTYYRERDRRFGKR